MLFDREFVDPASGAVSWDDDGTERVHNPDCGSAVTGNPRRARGPRRL